MTKGVWKTWAIFAACLLMVLAVMVWMSCMTIALEQAELEARRQAVEEENVRLALWRVESTLAPVIPQESARPYFHYSAFYPAGRAYSCMFDGPQKGDQLVPSPLLSRAAEHVLLHFQIGPDGEFTSPQIPTMSDSKLDSCPPLQQDPAVAEERLAYLRGRLDRGDLLHAPSWEVDEPVDESTFQLHLLQNVEPVPHGAQRQQILKRNENEIRKLGCGPMAGQNFTNWNSYGSPADVREGPLRPVWVGELLLLARQVVVSGQEYVQGCWLDWPAIRERQLSLIRDLLPTADLVPVPSLPEDQEDRLVATIPVRLLPGEMVVDPEAGLSPIRLSLGVAWGCVLLAAGAVASLLGGAISLSSRRGAFVSAVTHELRTPLTTFRMYTEMLASGMIRDETKRRAYLEKLRAEADRLSHLVENVLGYARLEGGRAGPVEVIPIAQLFHRVKGRLFERAEQAGMTLVADGLAEDGSEVRTDPSAVEQILFNLVDNSSKYAAAARDRRIHLEATRENGAVAVRVSDHGPGVSARVGRRLFRPFSKSDREAAHSAPGVGLGLAFSRQLARGMGGDLRLSEHGREGACFELLLPAA